MFAYADVMHVYDDPEHWRERADEGPRDLWLCRRPPESKQTLLQIAAAYDGLAQLAERRRSKRSGVVQLV